MNFKIGKLKPEMLLEIVALVSRVTPNSRSGSNRSIRLYLNRNETFFDLPTALPTYLPTYRPTDRPSHPPTSLPTYLPIYTYLPTYLPTDRPTYLLTYLPTQSPTHPPTYLPGEGLSIWRFTSKLLGAPRGFGDLGRRAIYFQGAGEHC